MRPAITKQLWTVFWPQVGQTPARAAVQRGALKPVLCDFELDDLSINAVWPPNRALSAKVRAFVDFLSDRFGGTPYWDDALPKANGASPL
jgi:DNA-binding transcriptional LysR family regulator